MTEKKPPLDLIVTRNGIPFDDQAEGIRAFKAACLKEEKPRDAPHAQSSAGNEREALRPFAAVAAADIGSDEADGDLFSPINHNRAPRLTVGDFRRALAALSAPAKPQATQELIATCTKLLPGGVLDDSTYSQIEDALDAIDAPMTGDSGRYLTLAERISALRPSVERCSAGNRDEIVVELRDLKPDTPVLTILDRCIRAADFIERSSTQPQATEVSDKDLLNWIENEASRGLTEGDAREALTAIKWKIKDGRG